MANNPNNVDVAAWHRRLVALGTEAFRDIATWRREYRNVVTVCFIRRSRHSSKLAMHVNNSKLESANATTRSEHLDTLTRLCGERTFEDSDIHPLDNYHLTPVPTAAAVPASSLAVTANSEQKPSQWGKKPPTPIPRPPAETCQNRTMD